jgi:hypothetical protein
MLYSFQPLTGPNAGKIYVLPPILFTDFSISLEIDKQVVDFNELAEATGSWSGTGLSPAYIADAVYTCKSNLSDGWRRSQGYAAGIGGLYTARGDFVKSVIQGGLGTLRLRYGAGFYVTNSSNQKIMVTGGLTNVKMMGNHTETWKNDVDLEIGYQFQANSATVTLQPGNMLMPIA